MSIDRFMVVTAFLTMLAGFFHSYIVFMSVRRFLLNYYVFGVFLVASDNGIIDRIGNCTDEIQKSVIKTTNV
jgi:hypothetical protein